MILEEMRLESYHLLLFQDNRSLLGAAKGMLKRARIKTIQWPLTGSLKRLHEQSLREVHFEWNATQQETFTCCCTHTYVFQQQIQCPVSSLKMNHRVTTVFKMRTHCALNSKSGLEQNYFTCVLNENC